MSGDEIKRVEVMSGGDCLTFSGEGRVENYPEQMYHNKDSKYL